MLGLIEILVIVKPLPVAGVRKPIQTILRGEEETEEIISSHLGSPEVDWPQAQLNPWVHTSFPFLGSFLYLQTRGPLYEIHALGWVGWGVP